jgi:polysaccharide export outer membrane protein
MIQQRGLGEQLRQRIQQSGLTPDQIRARLRGAGYSETLIDAYLQPSQAGQNTPPPSAEMLRGARALGLNVGPMSLPDSMTPPWDSIYLTRSDSFLLDTLGLVVGEDSIPTHRDDRGMLRVDTVMVRALARRLKRSRVFGLDVFRRASTQFNPVTTGPVDPEYRLGAGDELVLILTGDVESVMQLPVSREGFVVIPQVGQVQVANLTMAQLRTLLMQRLGRVYSGVRPGPNASTRFDVTLSRIRANQIFVTGDVVRPGAYSVSAIGTVLNALYQAGGPTERGSFRQVRVQRAGQTVATLDIYDYLIGGAARGDIRLESGDVVFVPPHGTRVTLEGEVLRPAIYELLPGQGIRDLIQIAGGLLPDASTSRASIERILPPGDRTEGRDRTALDIDLTRALASGGNDVPLAPDDKVRIYGVTLPIRNRVTVLGNVWQPGAYGITPAMRLSQIIQAAGGLRPDTYLERAHILRTMPDSTRRLISVDLRRALTSQGAGPASDPELQEFDEITIFSRSEFRPGRRIAVFGSVQRPGDYAFRDSSTLRDVILQAGGLRDEAYLLEAEISRIPTVPGGDSLAVIIRVPLDSSYVTDVSSYLRRPAGARASEVVLQPFDNIFIRRLPGFTLQRNVIISGEVKFPGRYTISRDDERLTDLINRAGGLTDAAYARGTQLYRSENRAGRVGIDFERILREPAYRDNLLLMTGDSIYVPLYQPVVQVEGAVNSPVAVAFVPGRSASYYVDRAGGFARRADKGRTYIVQQNGAVQRRGDRVDPGARVVVPEKPLDEPRANIVQIVSTAATIVATLLSAVVLAKQF